MGSKLVRDLATAVLPEGARRWLRAQQRRFRLQWVPTGAIDFGDLGRRTPISPVFALDRGLPVDRYYIEQFLASHASDIRGRVLEAGDSRYTRKFGGEHVTHSDVLHVAPGNPAATIVADLTRADHIPERTFDCIVLTQTLQMIFDVQAALHHVSRILRPGGVFLLTSGGITKIARWEGRDPWGEYWHFTSQSVMRLLREFFPADCVEVRSYGNVLSAVAALYGLAAEDLSRDDLSYHDPDFEVLVAARAIRPGDD